MSWFPWRRKKDETPDEKKDDVVPVVPETPVPEIKPSNLQFVNYIRALLILNQIPFRKLRDELKKLPWLDIFYVLGILVWILMSYLLIRQLVLVFTL
jgi:hypothetical protein